MGRRGQSNLATPARRQGILNAALACFEEYGVAATTIEQIRDRAGCSIGSLYHHFGSKDGVASALFIDGIEDLNAGLLARLEVCSTAEQGVRACVLHYADWVIHHRPLARFMVQAREIHFAVEAKVELKAIYQRHFGAVFSWFGRFVLNGDMKQLPPETYIPIISGPIEDYARLWLSGRIRTPLADVAEVFAEAAWNAVRGQAGSGGA